MEKLTEQDKAILRRAMDLLIDEEGDSCDYSDTLDKIKKSTKKEYTAVFHYEDMPISIKANSLEEAQEIANEMDAPLGVACGVDVEDYN